MTITCNSIHIFGKYLSITLIILTRALLARCFSTLFDILSHSGTLSNLTQSHFTDSSDHSQASVLDIYSFLPVIVFIKVVKLVENHDVSRTIMKGCLRKDHGNSGCSQERKCSEGI